MIPKRSIMIVDDNPDNLNILCQILEKYDYEVRPVLSGDLALRAMVAYTPDLILLDINMPGMDGYEVCKRIKTNEETRDTPIIFISALDDITSKLKAFQVGGLDYITKPFQFEEVLARVNTQLELSYTRKALSEANAHLHDMMDKMVQSEKLKSLGSLAAGVAHELNTPIGNALLSASTLNQLSHEFINTTDACKSTTDIEELLSTCNECSQLILRNLQRAAKLVKSFKEIAVDQSSERRRSIVLKDCVNDVTSLMKFSFKQTPITINNTIDPALTMETYPGRIEQILDNLISNAIIHGFKGKEQGAITIAAKKISSDKINIQISDNGLGIPAENLNKVFDPFFTTRLGQGGSGMGLHIVYNLVTNILGGDIHVSSEVGAGSTFSIILPCLPSTIKSNRT